MVPKGSNRAERWLARNRSLETRQTPVWAQSLVGIMIGLGVTAVTAGFLFRIDEVVTVTGQRNLLWKCRCEDSSRRQSC